MPNPLYPTKRWQLARVPYQVAFGCSPQLVPAEELKSPNEKARAELNCSTELARNVWKQKEGHTCWITICAIMAAWNVPGCICWIWLVTLLYVF